MSIDSFLLLQNSVVGEGGGRGQERE